MAGRPKVRTDLARLTTLTVGDADFIFDSIGEGKILWHIAQRFGVGRTALAEWIDASPERKERYKRARERSASALAEATIAIADGPFEPNPNGPFDQRQSARDAAGKTFDNEPDAARDKLRIQARQWLASRWDRDTYGQAPTSVTNIDARSLHIDSLRRTISPQSLQSTARLLESSAQTVDSIAPAAEVQFTPPASPPAGGTVDGAGHLVAKQGGGNIGPVKKDGAGRLSEKSGMENIRATGKGIKEEVVEEKKMGGVGKKHLEAPWAKSK